MLARQSWCSSPSLHRRRKKETWSRSPFIDSGKKKPGLVVAQSLRHRRRETITWPRRPFFDAGKGNLVSSPKACGINTTALIVGLALMGCVSITTSKSVNAATQAFGHKITNWSRPRGFDSGRSIFAKTQTCDAAALRYGVTLIEIPAAPLPIYRGWRYQDGRYLVRLCDLVGAPRGRPGPFFRLTGRGGHLGGLTTKWGGRGRPAGHAAVPPAVPR
jgi:hypothetical protein